jgi:hypothetical protein
MRPSRFNYIRLFCLTFFCVACAFVGNSFGADVEPYEARVTAPRALVLSGPGEKFYPTGTLSPGDIVEVYREQSGGWLGIRPPKGSFSAVSEKQITTRNGDLAEVRDDEVASRIGSQLSDKRNAVQVRLKRGSPADATAVGDSIAEPPAANDDKWKASAIPVAAATAGAVEPREVVPPPLAPLADSTRPPNAEPASAAATPASPNAAPAAAASAPVGFDLPRQLTEIELRLSRMASAPPQLWNTERLQRDTDQLLSQARTQADRIGRQLGRRLRRWRVWGWETHAQR